jgi:integrase
MEAQLPTVTLNAKTAAGLACRAGAHETIYWSNDLPGFGLRCRAGGARSWFVQYRTKAGQLRKHTLGAPSRKAGEGVSFAAARAEADRLLAAVKLGGDPAGDVKNARAAARAAITVRDLVTRYLKYQKSRMRVRSFEELRRHLSGAKDEGGSRPRHGKPLDAKPLHKHAGRVTRAMIAEVLEDIAEVAPTTANRVRASLSAMFAWGMKAGLAGTNPVAATFKPAEEKPRERVLTDHELTLIWSCTGNGADHDRIVRVLMLTGARREEIAGLAWSELTPNHDGTSSTWLLTSERSKNRLPHLLTLPPLTISQLPPHRQDNHGEPRDLVFGERPEHPFSGWSRCKKRLDDRIAGANGGKGIRVWVLHDLRRTFVTRLNDLGVEPHIVEALVNHVGGIAKAGVAGVYNLSAYAPQKRAALALWCDHIAKLTGGAESEQGSVVPLRRAG